MSESPCPLLSNVTAALFTLEDRQGEGADWKEEMCHFLLSLWRGSWPEQTDTDWFSTSLHGHSVCQVICTPAFQCWAVSISQCCTGDHLLLPCNFTDQIKFFFAYCMIFECFSSEEDGQRFFPCLHVDDDELLIAKGRTASFELGASCSVFVLLHHFSQSHSCASFEDFQHLIR